MTELASLEMSPQLDEVITYRHRVPLHVDFTYTLHSDRVVLTGSRIWVPKLEVIVWLNTLSLNTTSAWTRSLNLLWSFVVIICVAVFSMMLLSDAHLAVLRENPGADSAFLWVLGFCVVLLLPALVYAYRSRKLIRYTHLLSNEGVAILSVGDAGPEPQRYESFVQELLRRIKASRGTQNGC